jgi:hypothetical protein
MPLRDGGKLGSARQFGDGVGHPLRFGRRLLGLEALRQPRDPARALGIEFGLLRPEQAADLLVLGIVWRRRFHPPSVARANESRVNGAGYFDAEAVCAVTGKPFERR